MAYTLETDENHRLDLRDYIDHVKSAVDVRSEDSIVDSADALRALSNNATVLVDLVNEGLRDVAEFQSGNPYGAQSLTLARGDRWLIRANIWMPQARNAQARENEDVLHSYELPHDHDFSFLTVGHMGSGYETSIWEYEPEQVKGYPGEPVDMRFLEHTSLGPGKVMFYRASRDIHVQHYPSEISVSLNLMVVNPETRQPNQFLFDMEKGTIRSYLNGSEEYGPLLVCALAGHVGDDRTVDLLGKVAERDARPQLRFRAVEALAQLSDGDPRSVFEKALADPHPYVHSRVVERLAAP
ncbi:HEAT repeat domain-containing protein [Kitasatospora acidiphila]|uniref:HEAT repeat domain-containing protein n=1 Tax=Kitasatospora acidiphila TaxID=2567942 RepID=A0A540WD06_9ACTN|nr:HEAT repeat domain-containing protein [Kitasatospora acidiphila]TQF06921.1 HEAT repeat domain-containing protein [Kitasatospora acidiphila]